MVDTTAYCALLGMDFLAGVEGVVDTWVEKFSYLHEDTVGATLPLSCHTPTPLLVERVPEDGWKCPKHPSN